MSMAGVKQIKVQLLHVYLTETEQMARGESTVSVVSEIPMKETAKIVIKKCFQSCFSNMS